ncbi:MAG TPA: plastocyanin/azurin family copper-binding protein [Sphingomicrobium sp.]|nr:plastocyanin/azurin family copper-binding protein [Sphingomicrobium sp.]
MISRTALAAAAGGALALSACGVTGPAHTVPPPPAVAATVTMGMTSFEPAAVRIRPGQTVQWRNTSLVTHTVTADHRLAANPANVVLPPGAAPFHSGSVAAGQVWSYRFTMPGTYRYVCLPHERAGMIGTVIVE